MPGWAVQESDTLAQNTDFYPTLSHDCGTHLIDSDLPIRQPIRERHWYHSWRRQKSWTLCWFPGL